LDIEKCYDTVPFWAAVASSRRLKISEEFIQLMRNMDTTNSLRIDTPYGLTASFDPAMGLPQGDALSTTRWIIFYDPLLCKLQETANGFGIPRSPISVSALGYADDLNCIAEDHITMQTQLTMIFLFLQQFFMRMGPPKSSVHCNKHVQQKIPKDYVFKLGNSPIKIAEPHELVRVVGAYIPPDTKHKKTIANVNQSLGLAVSLVYKKHTPGQIAIYIINSIIIPKLLYRLQCTPVTPSFIEGIDPKLRRLARSKNDVNNEIKNDVLYDKSFGINLMSLRIQLDKQTMNNALLHARSSTLTTKVSPEAAKIFTKAMKVPKSILSHPIQHKWKTKFFMPYISHILEKHAAQHRNMTHEESDNILDIISSKAAICKPFIKSYGKNVTKN
jgi:hypothetical protein